MRTRRLRTLGMICASLLVAGTATVITMSQANAAVIDTSAWYNLVNRNSGKAMEITGGSTADQATVTQNTRSSANHQQFQFVDSGGGYYRLRARHSNKVIDLWQWNAADGAEFRQWPDLNANNQQFRVLDSDGGYVRLINRHSNKALEVWEWSTANGGRISQFSDLNGANQQFQLVRAGGGNTTPGPGTTTGAPPGGQRCAAYDAVTMGKYWINNNLWGQNSGSGSQCIWSNSTSGNTISWGTSWNWTGQTNSVKSYASSILGWHWGTRVAGSGLPVQLSANRSIPSTWNYNVSLQGGSNTLNVAYDLWAHTISNPTYANNPTDEIMIWTYRAGGAGPVGTRQTTVTIGGASYDLYRGNIGWNVFSFVRTSNTSSVNINLRDFLNDLVSRGWMSSSKYLTSVQAGTEVFIGQGRLDTTSYTTNVQ
ncbi:MAG TPA: RICIN domain-containing protein [Pilimelia sp.]|nr:RICIN domain-containing protein [Pilimelia sp.]